jgi:hypothetical protein
LSNWAKMNEKRTRDGLKGKKVKMICESSLFDDLDWLSQSNHANCGFIQIYCTQYLVNHRFTFLFRAPRPSPVDDLNGRHPCQISPPLSSATFDMSTKTTEIALNGPVPGGKEDKSTEVISRCLAERSARQTIELIWKPLPKKDSTRLFNLIQWTSRCPQIKRSQCESSGLERRCDRLSTGPCKKERF